MTIPIELDRRFKVDQVTVNRMRVLRKQGLSYQKVADEFGVSWQTAYYWCCDSYRKKKRKINANRRISKDYRNKHITPKRVERRKEMWKEFPLTYIAHMVQSAKDENRTKRHTIHRKTIEYWEKFLESHNFKQGDRKIV